MPFSVREGINVFLSGFVHTENIRFRDEELNFKEREIGEEKRLLEKQQTEATEYTYPKINKTIGDFNLIVEAGSFSNSEIIVMLGQNGTGKTTLIRLLAGILKPDEEDVELPRLNVSYKVQKIAPKFEGKVKHLFLEKL